MRRSVLKCVLVLLSITIITCIWQISSLPLDGHDGYSRPFIAKAVKLPHPREMEAVESCPEPVFLGDMTD